MASRLRKKLAAIALGMRNVTFRKAVVLLTRAIMGCVFMYVGFWAVIDIDSSCHRTEAYLNALSFEVLVPLTFLITLLVASFRLMIGVCLFLGANIKSSAIFLLCYLLLELLATFFAIDELYGAGAVIWLDILFFLLGILVFVWRSANIQLYTKRTEWVIAIYSFLYSVSLALYCHFSLPIIDRTPVCEGDDFMRNMRAAMMKHDEYRMKRAMKDGLKREEYASRDTILQEDMYCLNVIDSALNKQGYAFILLSENIAEASTSARLRLNSMYSYARENGYSFFCITSSPLGSPEIEEYVIESAGAEYEFYHLRDRLLNSVARSNPELLVLKDGLLIRKFAAHKIPIIQTDIAAMRYGKKSESNDNHTLFVCISVFAIPLLVILAYDYFIELCVAMWRLYKKRRNERKKLEKESI